MLFRMKDAEVYYEIMGEGGTSHYHTWLCP
ncbi:hypothetical protein KQ1_03717 [Bacillus cereus BAG3O-1]|nr:hypothetical protein KQ1_03717 [Bacillus cereus BAG3O-1]SCV21323.1 Uncharacterized protein BCRIVMBC845_03868 [Bacillus cereus]